MGVLFTRRVLGQSLGQADDRDLHVHEHYHEHLHIETAAEPKHRKAKPERIKVEIHKPKVDPECERLRREYEEKVRELKARMGL